MTRNVVEPARGFVILDLDVWQAAKVLIDEHGEGAAKLVTGRANRSLGDRDVQAAMPWLRILEAIEELQRGRREGEALN